MASLSFEELELVCQQHLEQGLDVGLAVAVYREGEEIFHFDGGERDPFQHLAWEKRTPVLIWSTGKGMAMATFLHCLQEHDIPLERKVASLWPEFGVAGKSEITLAQLLSYRAGMSVLLRSDLEVDDHEGVAAALAAQPPYWEDRKIHGYSPITIGYLIDELLRRLMGGEHLADYWRRVFADPLGLDIWFGLPQQKFSEVATILPAREGPKESPFTTAFNDPTSLTRRAFGSGSANLPVRKMNEDRYRQASLVAFGAIATADALARFYSLITTFPNHFFDEKRGRWIQEIQTQGIDQTLLVDQQFSAGFIINSLSGKMGPHAKNFGHAGLGGSLAFADPVSNIGFAYTPNAMSNDEGRTQEFIDALYGR